MQGYGSNVSSMSRLASSSVCFLIKCTRQCDNDNRMMKPGVFTGFPALSLRRLVQAELFEQLDINGSSRLSALSDTKSSTVQ